MLKERREDMEDLLQLRKAKKAKRRKRTVPLAREAASAIGVRAAGELTDIHTPPQQAMSAAVSNDAVQPHWSASQGGQDS